MSELIKNILISWVIIGAGIIIGSVMIIISPLEYFGIIDLGMGSDLASKLFWAFCVLAITLILYQFPKFTKVIFIAIGIVSAIMVMIIFIATLQGAL